MQTCTYVIFPLLARNNINKSLKYLARIYEQNKKSAENWEIFSKFTQILTFLVKLIVMDYAVCVSAFILSPALSYLFIGSVELILPWYVPGTSRQTTIELAVNLFLQGAAMTYAGVSYAFYNILFVVQILHVILMTNILMAKLRSISQLAEANAANKNTAHAGALMNLRNVILLYTELIE